MLIRLGHILLAFAVLISATGVVLNKHYCQDELKSVSLFLEAEPCHKAKAMATCPFHANMNQQADKEEKGCCDDETELLQSEQDQFNYPSQAEVELNPNFFIPAFVTAFLLPDEDLEITPLEYLNYRPPLIVYDLPIRLQVFLC